MCMELEEYSVTVSVQVLHDGVLTLYDVAVKSSKQDQNLSLIHI